MARIKFGNVVVDMRGKVSGNVYSKNKGGAYSRVRVVPVNPRSAAQNLVRSVFTALSQAWQGLTETQRSGWSQAAVNFPAKNSLGDTHTLSGNALYVSLNKNLDDVNIAPIDEAPTRVVATPLDIPTIVADSSSQTLVPTFGSTIPADVAVKVFASASTSAGVNSIGSKMRQIGVLAPGSTATPSLTAMYLAKFGTIGDAGSKIFLNFVPVAIANGQLGSTIRTSTIIVA